jgi:PAS domain S-box-containing protein
MLENLFQSFRSSTPASPKAMDDVATLGTGIAARLLNVPLVVLIQVKGETGTAIWLGQGAGRIRRIPPMLLQTLGDPQGFSPFVVRDARSAGRWKSHPLAGAVANIGLTDDFAGDIRFAAAAPLRAESIDSPGTAKSGIQSVGALLVLDIHPRPDWTDEQTAALCDLADLLSQMPAPLSRVDTPPSDLPALLAQPSAAPDGALARAADELRAEIAERQRTEEALRDSERLFRAVVQSASDAIVLCDGNARVVAWNKGATRMFGFSEEAVLGRPLWDLLSRSAGGRRVELERLCREEVRRLNIERDDDAPRYADRSDLLAPFEALGRRATGGEFPVELLLNLWQGEQKLYINAIIRDVSARQQAEGLRSLSHAVSRILAEAPTLDEAGHSILRAIGEGRAWSMGGLWLIKRGASGTPGTPSAAVGPVLRMTQTWAQSGTDFREIETIRRQSAYACGVGLPGRVWAAGEPFWVEDLTRDPHTPRASALTRAGFRTAMGFPIRFGHEILGVIDLYSHEVWSSDGNLLEMASAFGNQIGQFIARKQVEQEIRARARQQATVARLGQRALSRSGLEILLTEAVALVSNTLAVEGCTILELMPDEKNFRTRSGVGSKLGVLGEIGIAADETSQAGWTLIAREPVIVEDYQTETRFANSPALEAFGAVSGVSVVITGSENPFGVLLAYAAHERLFAPDDVHFLEAVANVIAAASEREQSESALMRAHAAEESARLDAEKAQQDAEAARVEAERANKAKSEFLSRMSHELRTPLNAILGFCQLLEMEELTDDQSEFVRQIGQGGSHLLKLINEVLQIARIESGRLSLTCESFPIGPAARESVELIKPLAAKRNITVQLLDSPDWERDVYADRGRMHEILLNYLSNAVKYNREAGQITVSCAESEEGCLRLGVADTGPGIPPEKLALLFQPFERLDADATTIEGTGLGLALVRNVADAMGGRAGAHSEVGEGSVFWVDFPLSDNSNSSTAHEAQDSPSRVPALAALSGMVLSIDDNASNRQLIERILEHHQQIELLSASDGNEGLQLARRTGPDVILLDLEMPGMNGFAVLELLRKDPGLRMVPVVILTADATEPAREKAMSLGAFAYLTKPLDVRLLLSILAEVLPPVR